MPCWNWRAVATNGPTATCSSGSTPSWESSTSGDRAGSPDSRPRAVRFAMPPDPTVAAPPRYDLLTEPWIPCLDRAGAPLDLGLLEVLRRAHELREVRDPSPPVTL